MIISRAPVRITLGGGGTDLPSYYKKFGGYVISATIDKYVFVSANDYFWNEISLKYSKQEIVKNIGEIKHDLFREALRLFDLKNRVELTSLADIPAGTGLGSSGAFLVALLNTLYMYSSGKHKTCRSLAEKACKIEIDILKEHEGKQDKYACAFGGLNAYTFHKNGDVSVNSLKNSDIIASELKKRILIFFTGKVREHKASQSLEYQDEETNKQNIKVIEPLHKIKKLCEESKKSLECGDYDAYGRLLHEHWEEKKKIRITTDYSMNKIYSHAQKLGALGGKVMGAGTDSGFFMFYYPKLGREKTRFEEEMSKVGLYKLDFDFCNDGVKTIVFGGKYERAGL